MISNEERTHHKPHAVDTHFEKSAEEFTVYFVQQFLNQFAA